jgi:glyoxylase-like metal-dependent hydrolase (beta-lactamase superfamily II)
VKELAPGLRRWTSWHDHWEEDVGSVAVETDDGLVLIDPNDPPDEVGTPAHVLLTVYWHARGTKELGPPRVWSSSRSAQPLRNRGIEVTDLVGGDEELPGGIRAFPTARGSEVVYWLPEQRAVVVGDVLLGAGAKPRATSEPLRLCPEGWLGTKPTHEDLRRSLRPLLELPVERVLVSHGEPVLADGQRELERVLTS